MPENETEQQLERLLQETSTERFAPFFENRVIAAIREEESAGFFESTLFAELMSISFRRLAIPVTAACLIAATYNVQTSQESMFGPSANLVEAMFSIPPENTNAAIAL